ncbi:MAG: hypothetical protein PHV66_00770 [Bacteroidales bacterium]|nr:hypothetical protein [Bacteroidales bacterium]
MKLEIKAIIKGDFVLDKPVKAMFPPCECVIYEEKGTYYISIFKKIVDYRNYIPRYYTDSGNTISGFTVTKVEIYEDMINLLQYIESMGAFNFGIHSISWDEPQIIWIPQADEERGIMPILSHQKKYRRDSSSKILKDSNLMNLSIYREGLNGVYIPFTYYRQGRILFDLRQYYFAYINFFMMLEYCFANGKFKKDTMLREFTSCHILRQSIESTLKMIKEDTNKTHFEWLKQECENRHKEVDVEGILYVLVEFRGLLSHATKLSEKYLFHSNELFSLALIISCICFYVCGHLQIGNCLFGKQKEEYLFGTGR